MASMPEQSQQQQTVTPEPRAEALAAAERLKESQCARSSPVIAPPTVTDLLVRKPKQDSPTSGRNPGHPTASTAEDAVFPDHRSEQRRLRRLALSRTGDVAVQLPPSDPGLSGLQQADGDENRVVAPPALREVPPFFCPIQPKRGAHPEAVDRGTVAWLDRVGVHRGQERRDYLARMNVGLLASLTIPDGPVQRRQIYSDLLMCTFALDDALFDEPDIVPQWDRDILLLQLSRLLHTPEAISSGNDLWPVAALHDLRARVAEIATPAQLQQFVAAYNAYLFNALVVDNSRRRNPAPTLNDYTMMRLGDGAMSVFLGAVPIVGDYQLTDTELADPRVRALEEMAALLPMWDNDIFGYDKEAHRAARFGYPIVPNLIDIVARENGCSTQRARRLAMAMRDRVMCRFLHVQKHLLSESTPNRTRYITTLGHWVRGYLEWAFTTHRYRDHGDSATRVAMPTTWAERPTDNSRDPLPLPTIAWWWDHALD